MLQLPDVHPALEALASAPSVERKEIVDALNAVYREERSAIETQLAADPISGAVRAIGSYSNLTDWVVKQAYQFACKRILEGQEPSSPIAILAVGGFGRAEMAPHSDVDLLFLVPHITRDQHTKLIEEMLYILWDMKLKLGHATRSVRECIKLGAGDQTIRTTLLEQRFLAGDTRLSKQLNDHLQKQKVATNSDSFVSEKLEERAQRHKRQGGQRYMLEPNVKEGKGGLRDLQSMFWIASYVGGATSHGELIEQGFLTQDEYEMFEAAHNFLWAVRCHLHLAAGRPTEQLTFDLQIEVADRMGYKTDEAMRGVEHFMQEYFRNATMVGELTRVFVTAFEDKHVKSSPSFSDNIKNLIWRKKDKAGSLDPLFCLENERINLVDSDNFIKDPLNLLRIFQEGLRTGLLIHQDAMRVVVANLDLIDDKMRKNPEAQKLFLSLLLDYGNPERALRLMNELGVLGTFIPEFKRVIAMMQFNVYHHYTVDEHTIQVISVLADLEDGKLEKELPIVNKLVKQGFNRRVMFVALLLHDIGKGLPEDHSIAGARLAKTIAPELGLNDEETDLVVWLVRNHLVMSDFAQKRDLSDPRTVSNFSAEVKTVNRLNLLTILTACDIKGVGPDTLNNWRAQLIRDLYYATRAQLTDGMDITGRYLPIEDAKAELESALQDWDISERENELSRHYDPYWKGLDNLAHVTFAHMLRDLTDSKISIRISIDPNRDATRVSFAMQDHPGLFKRMAGALAVVGANVVDARTYTSSDGYAVSVFWVQDNEGHPFKEAYHERLRDTVLKTMAGDVIPQVQLKDKNILKKRERDFAFATEIIFDNEGSEYSTIIEVETRDRESLLYDLARVLHDTNIRVENAVIATYGAQAVDVFYVKDMFGLKIHSEAKQQTIANRLRQAIKNIEKADA